MTDNRFNGEKLIRCPVGCGLTLDFTALRLCQGCGLTLCGGPCTRKFQGRSHCKPCWRDAVMVEYRRAQEREDALWAGVEPLMDEVALDCMATEVGGDA